MSIGIKEGLQCISFGISARHEIPIPEMNYVNNPKNLTEYEKELS